MKSEIVKIVLVLFFMFGVAVLAYRAGSSSGSNTDDDLRGKLAEVNRELETSKGEVDKLGELLKSERIRISDDRELLERDRASFEREVERVGLERAELEQARSDLERARSSLAAERADYRTAQQLIDDSIAILEGR